MRPMPLRGVVYSVLSGGKQFVVASIKWVVKRVFIFVMNFKPLWNSFPLFFVNSDV